MTTIKNAIITTVHHIPLLTSLDEIWIKTQRAALKHVKTNTDAVTADPGSQFPKSGLSQLYLALRVPAVKTTSEVGVASDTEEECSDDGDVGTAALGNMSKLGLYL